MQQKKQQIQNQTKIPPKDMQAAQMVNENYGKKAALKWNQNNFKTGYDEIEC